jgi:hypothetical protein
MISFQEILLMASSSSERWKPIKYSEPVWKTFHEYFIRGRSDSRSRFKNTSKQRKNLLNSYIQVHTEANKLLLGFLRGTHDTSWKEIGWQSAQWLPGARNCALRRNPLESQLPVSIKCEVSSLNQE